MSIQKKQSKKLNRSFDSAARYNKDTLIILFGITGDLSRSKLIPSLMRLWKKDHSLSFVGFGRKDFSKDESSSDSFSNFIKKYSGDANFSNNWKYVQSDLDEDRGYRELKNIIGTNTVGKKRGKSLVFYIALPPQFQKVVASKIIENFAVKNGTANSSKYKSESKLPKDFVLAFEKPFGYSSASAKALNKMLLKSVREEQILRVDHYAGKQALIDMEKGAELGALGESFNNNHISKITVHFLEKNSANGRGAFYDHVGALADVLQNHMLYMLSTALAVPYILNSSKKNLNKNIDKIREEVLAKIKYDFKNSVNKNVELGQYKSFKKESGVSPKSKTETSFIIKGKISKADKYWGGVDVEFIGGKSMSENDSAIYLQYNKSTVVKTNQAEDVLRLPINGYSTREAYDEIFQSAICESLGQKTGRFVSLKQILEGWKLVEKIKKLKIKPKLY